MNCLWFNFIDLLYFYFFVWRAVITPSIYIVLLQKELGFLCRGSVINLHYTPSKVFRERWLLSLLFQMGKAEAWKAGGDVPELGDAGGRWRPASCCARVTLVMRALGPGDAWACRSALGRDFLCERPGATGVLRRAHTVVKSAGVVFSFKSKDIHARPCLQNGPTDNNPFQEHLSVMLFSLSKIDFFFFFLLSTVDWSVKVVFLFFFF